MDEFKFTVKIDGEEYTPKQLKRIEYERTLHVLHEMKGLGAEITDGNGTLTHEDINWLAPEEAERVLLDAKMRLSEQEMLDLFRKPEKDAERRWKAYAEDYRPEDALTGTTEVSVRGVTVPETMAILGGAADMRQAVGTFAEHYIVIGDIKSGQRGMEAFGLFGEPVYVHGVAADIVPEGLPVEEDPSYPMTMFGEMLLKSDDTPIHVGAYHRFRPLADGFDVKSTLFCPGKAPRAIAEGHKIHFAIEIVNSAEAAYENRHA